MTDEAYARLKELLEECEWKQEMDGTTICSGMLGVCSHIIDSKQCPVCIHFFKQLKEEEK